MACNNYAAHYVSLGGPCHHCREPLEKHSLDAVAATPARRSERAARLDIAKHALAGLNANPEHCDEQCDDLVPIALSQADALLAALSAEDVGRPDGNS